MNIIFAGTPAFALPCLQALAQTNHLIQAVYTQADKPAGRGRQLQASPVKVWAEAQGIAVHQPLNFKAADTVDELSAFNPDLMIVIAYGLILPQAVLNIPRFGCINVHASLLPRFRGASPIQQAILHGDLETGVTIMQMDKGMDTGMMLSRAPCPIEATDTAGRLHDKLAALSVAPLLSTLIQFEHQHITPEPQPTVGVTYAPKILKEDAKISWLQSAIEIERRVRAFNPWPIAYTEINHQSLRIHQARVLAQSCNKAPGTILSIDKTGLAVATQHHILLIERIQFPGGKVIAVKDWLNSGKQDLQLNMIFE